MGTTYRHEGPDAALKLGEALVSGETRAARVARWHLFCSKRPAALFCARGGLRSKIAQQWLLQSGIQVPRVEGGYKSLRRYLLTVLDRASDLPFIVVAGRTGSGKTRLLETLLEAGESTIDLERAAVHRGSAFGAFDRPQPKQSTFENALAVGLLRSQHSSLPIFVEDESRQVGKLKVPEPFFRAMSVSPMLVVEAPFHERIDNIIRDYISAPLKSLGDTGVSEPFDVLGARLTADLRRLHRRLGGERLQKLDTMLQEALFEHRSGSSAHVHEGWIGVLLKDYYDPLYDRHLLINSHRIIATTSAKQCATALPSRVLSFRRPVSMSSFGPLRQMTAISHPAAR